MEKQTLDLKLNEAWKEASVAWHSPSVPHVIAAEDKDDFEKLGETGRALQGELAFMKYPEFQTYVNLETVVDTFKEDPVRGVKAVLKHELGHRFCPYDVVTSILLRHAIKKELDGKKLPYDSETAAGLILNLFTDMSINTIRVNKNQDQDILWAYKEISKGKGDSRLWRAYGGGMELSWRQEVLPTIKLKDDELEAAQEIASLFESNPFDKSKWMENARNYTRIIHPFLEDKKKDKGASSMDDCSENIPKTLDEKTTQEIAKRLAEIGSNGIPKNPSALKDFKEIMAGFGQGDSKKASITFYDKLSDSYEVMFATQPFGRPRVNPFQPVKWTPSQDVSKLDVDYSVQSGGRIIPGVTTYTWNTRKRDAFGGLEEVVPNLDLYLDSSMSMTDPVNGISLPVLAGFVAAKKAYRKGSQIRSTNFSGKGQSATVGPTRDLDAVFGNLVTYYGGGTVFPSDTLLEGFDPKQVLLVTDTFLGNEKETSDAITELRKRNKGNRVSVYAIHPNAQSDYLRSAGAEVISGTNTDIFKRVIGKSAEVYSK